jgi:hypothetical protein
MAASEDLWSPLAENGFAKCLSEAAFCLIYARLENSFISFPLDRVGVIEHHATHLKVGDARGVALNRGRPSDMRWPEISGSSTGICFVLTKREAAFVY